MLGCQPLGKRSKSCVSLFNLHKHVSLENSPIPINVEWGTRCGVSGEQGGDGRDGGIGQAFA